MKLSKAQLSKITQSGGFLGSWLGNLGKKVILDYSVPFTRDKLSRLVSNIASNAPSNAKNEFEGRISRIGAVRAGRGFLLFISNKDMDDIIRIDGVTETVQHEIKITQEDGAIFLDAILGPLAAQIAQPLLSSAVKAITGKRVPRSGRGYNNIDHKDQIF